MIQNEKRYVINVDFATESKVHLNPNHFGKIWCRLNEEKKPEDGGKLYVDAKEALEYLEGKRILIFNGKRVKKLSQCINCSKRGKQRIHWNI
jgi:hypothetical protein